MTYPAAFLDRDGVINVDNGYPHKVSDFIFLPDVLPALKIISRHNFKIIICTNQSGIARGYYSYQEFEVVSKYMLNFFKNNSIVIDGLYHCPHHPLFGSYAERNCACRKPKPGMIYQAVDDHNIDLNNSFLVGDKVSDILAGLEAGIPKRYLITAESANKNTLSNYSHPASSLLQAVQSFFKTS